MEFNKIKRGADRAANDEVKVYEILDAGFLCHVAFQYEAETMIIPTAFGRKDNSLYLHGSTKNHMLNNVILNETVCISVTHLDGIVLAKTLFDTSANYRSVVLFGTAHLVTEETERVSGLKIITEHIINGRWNEVPVGTENQLKATMIIRFDIVKASVKIRAGGPQGDERELNAAWSGHIPLKLKASEPVFDSKFGTSAAMTDSVLGFWKDYQ